MGQRNLMKINLMAVVVWASLPILAAAQAAPAPIGGKTEDDFAGKMFLIFAAALLILGIPIAGILMRAKARKSEN